METRMESYREIKKIMKQFHLYRRVTDKEIRLLNMKIAKLQKMIEKSMIHEDNPDEYEVKAIRNFEAKKTKGKLVFVPLDSLN
jgi:ribosome-interacting GTPase 1